MVVDEEKKKTSHSDHARANSLSCQIRGKSREAGHAETPLHRDLVAQEVETKGKTLEVCECARRGELATARPPAGAADGAGVPGDNRAGGRK